MSMFRSMLDFHMPTDECDADAFVRFDRFTCAMCTKNNNEGLNIDGRAYDTHGTRQIVLCAVHFRLMYRTTETGLSPCVQIEHSMGEDVASSSRQPRRPQNKNRSR